MKTFIVLKRHSTLPKTALQYKRKYTLRFWTIWLHSHYRYLKGQYLIIDSIMASRIRLVWLPLVLRKPEIMMLNFTYKTIIENKNIKSSLSRQLCKEFLIEHYLLLRKMILHSLSKCQQYVYTYCKTSFL